MGKPYEAPVVEFVQFDGQDVITTSFGIAKNPGHLCDVMPNGKPIPKNAEGRFGNH